MKRTFLRSKIHRATVTQADLDYDGSVSIDASLLKLADIQPYEQVDIYNISRGTRLTTYAIEAPADSGEICINGAAAHLMKPTDLVIICCYAQFDESELAPDPIVIKVNEHNALRNWLVIFPKGHHKWVKLHNDAINYGLS